MGLGGGSSGGAASAGAAAAAAGTIPVGDPTAADANWGAAKKRVAVAADNQEAATITSYAKPDFVKQLIRKHGSILGVFLGVAAGRIYHVACSTLWAKPHAALCSML